MFTPAILFYVHIKLFSVTDTLESVDIMLSSGVLHMYTKHLQICKTKQSLEILESTKVVDIFSEAHFTRVFCCYARISCFAVVGEMQLYAK